jgi:dihydroxyacetone kinase-like predicted kinase
VVEGDALDSAAIEQALEPMGDSLLVVGDSAALKAHVHTDEPGAALTVGTRHGAISHVEINDMHRQTAERTARLEATPSVGAPAATTAAVAVYSGEGNGRLLADAGAALLVDGGETMNPSAGALLEAIGRADAPEVVVLPNDANVVMAAERAAADAGRPAVVVPTESIPAGLAALVALDPALTAAENAELMTGAAEGVAAGSVARASREASLNGVSVREGDWVGLLGREAVDAGPVLDEVAQAVIRLLLAEPRDVLTLLRGADAPDVTGLVAELTRLHPDLEIDVHDGDQAHYALLLSAE